MLSLSPWKIIAVTLSVVFGLLFTLPNVLPASTVAAMPGWLPHQRLNLGLDLQGGSYLLMEVDTDALNKERLGVLLDDMRSKLREAQIETTAPVAAASFVSLRVTDPAKVDAAYDLLNKQLGGKLSNGQRDTVVTRQPNQVLQAAFAPGAADQAARDAVTQSIEKIRRRIDLLGTKEPAITQQGTSRIVIEAPGEGDPEKLKAVIGKTAKLTFQMVDVDPAAAEDLAAGQIPPDDEYLPSDDGYRPGYLVKKRALVTGEMLTNAAFVTDSQSGRPAVSFAFNSDGAKRFGKATSENVGKPFAIVLDKRIISAPNIQTPILAGNGQITGNFTPETATTLAIQLKAGALPAPLKVEEQRTVGAELGADAVKAGEVSLAIGAAAIFAFIIVAYGMFGVYAAIALVVNVMMMIGALSMTQATLTLPGIAGLILTMAVAVDANVLIYERMRDEANAGRAPMAAADTGYRRAMVSILDANVTTMISALIMFQFGAGPVKGFAWTLSIGVVTSVFTAIVVTQLLIGLWFRLARPKALPIA